MRLNNYIAARRERINRILVKHLPHINQEPARLHAAMHYAVLNGGKRFRPLLIYAAGETFAADLAILDIPACAIELVHCYSLIHDDLPAMDNDDMRRGKPSCHKAFDEATAILAGNSLFNLAMQVLIGVDIEPVTRDQMLVVLTSATSSFGMAGGQAIDLESCDKQLTLEQLEHMHNLKTGALIRASVKLGVLAAADITSEQFEKLDKFAACLGLAFQVQDDILDANEIVDNKTTYVSLLGLEQAKAKLWELKQQALLHLKNLELDTKLLQLLTETFLGLILTD